MLLREIKSIATKSFLTLLTVFFFNEYLIYYMIQFRCDWPGLKSNNLQIPPLRCLIIADTHLLGKRRGHWFDKLRREWQMHRSFQSAITLHNPEVVFVLGDLFDEGLWSNKQEMVEYHERFKDLFNIPKDTKMYTVAGNHDIGFHYEIFKPRAQVFEQELNAPLVNIITIRNIHFVLINSMAMEGDKCNLCQKAQSMIYNISDVLNCWKKTGSCKNVIEIYEYSRPILLQHFPLYRPSDELCNEWDSPVGKEKYIQFREKWECLSRESTEFLKILDFRQAWSGHTHHGCVYKHWENVYEYTVASFSWRNRNDPSYILAEFTPEDSMIYKCAIPTENTVLMLYKITIFGILFYWFSIFIRKKCLGRRNKISSFEDLKQR